MRTLDPSDLDRLITIQVDIKFLSRFIDVFDQMLQLFCRKILITKNSLILEFQEVFLSSTFVYEPILIKISMKATTEKTLR